MVQEHQKIWSLTDIAGLLVYFFPTKIKIHNTKVCLMRHRDGLVVIGLI